MEKKDFKKLCEELEYFSVENSIEKTVEEVMDEIRDFISESGWDCLDEDWNTDSFAKEWFEENHPEITEIEDVWVCDLEFLCANEYVIDHDVDWSKVIIEFHGIWEDEIGVFSVYLD